MEHVNLFLAYLYIYYVYIQVRDLILNDSPTLFMIYIFLQL